MELFCYLGIMSLSLIFSLKRDVISSPYAFFVFWITAYTSLILVVRNTFDADINSYTAAMSGSSLSIYYLKEPVVWLGQRYLFSWLQNPFFVFVISDLLAGLSLFCAFKNFNLPQLENDTSDEDTASINIDRRLNAQRLIPIVKNRNFSHRVEAGKNKIKIKIH